jgi:hypothetical protein
MGDLTLEGFRQALRDQFGDPGKADGKKPDGVVSSIGTKFDNAVSKFTEGVGVFFNGALSIQNAANSIMGSKTPVSDTIKQDFGKIPGINYLVEGQQRANQFSRQQGTTVDFSKLDSQAKRAGLTIEDWNETLNTARPTIGAIGMTAQQTNDKLADLAGDINSNKIAPELSNFKDNLTRSGTTQKDFADAALLSQANMTKANLNNTVEYEKAKVNAVALAGTIAQTSATYGISKDAIMQEMQERLKQPAVMAAMANMSEEQRQAFIRTTAAVSGMSPSIQKLAQDIGTVGAPSRESARSMALLGPAGQQMTAAVRAQNDPTKSAAEKAKMLADAQAAVDKRMQDPAFLRIASLGGRGNANADEAAKMLAESRTRQSTQAGMNQTGMTAQGARQQANLEGARQTQQQTPTGGKVAQTQELGGAVNLGNQRAGAAAAGAAEGTRRFLNQLDQVPAISKRAEDALRGITKVYDGKDLANKASEVTSTAGAPKRSGTTTVPPVSKEFGSLGTVGKLIEDFGKGTPAVLHGKEGVVTENQMQDIVASAKQMGAQNKDGGADQLKGMMGAVKDQATAKNTGGVDQIKGMMGNLRDQISGGAGGQDQMKNMVGSIKEQMNAKSSANMQNMVGNLRDMMPKTTDLSMSGVADAVKPKPVTPTATATETATTSSKTAVKSEEGATIKDLHTALLDLNKNMMRMISHTESISEASNKSAKYAGKATGNRNY